MVVCVGLEAWGRLQLHQARERLEQEVGPLEQSSLNVPNENNVATVLIEIEDWWDQASPDPLPRSLVEIRDPRRWSDDELKQIEGALARTVRWRDIARQARHRTKVSYPTGESRSLTSALSVSRLLLAEVGVALREGDEATALENLEVMERLEWALSHGSGSAHHIIAPFVERELLRGVRWLAEDPKVSMETLQALRGGVSTEDVVVRVRRMAATFAVGDLEILDAIDRGVVLEGYVPYPSTHVYRWVPGTIELNAAELMDARLQMLGAAGTPVAGVEPMHPTEPRRFPARYLVSVASSVEFVGRIQSVTAMRNLGRRALELRIEASKTGRYPRTSSLGPDPLTGDPPEYEVSESGARLAYPSPRKHREIFVLKSDRPHALSLEWKLPPVR